MAQQVGLSSVNFLLAAGASLSAGVPVGALVPVGIQMPSAWTVAPITAQVSTDDGNTWSDMFDGAGDEITLQVAAGRFVELTSEMWQAANFFRLRSGTSAAPVVQTSDRTITMVLRSR